MIKLDDIYKSFSSDVVVKGVTCDSREVKSGYIFVAIEGEVDRGEDYIDEAVKKGAIAIVASQNYKNKLNVPVIKEDNPRKSLSYISSLVFSENPETICAITGTNGKTSTTNFLQQIWSLMGLNASSIGTLGIIGNEEIKDTNNTTPDPVALHQTLDNLFNNKITHLALEASSHGLAQHRIDNVPLRAAGFTNISQDHLDYHQNMEAYFDAKKRLFTEILPKENYAVICIDTDQGRELSTIINNTGRGVIEVGESANAFNLRRLTPNQDGMEMVFQYSGRLFSIPLRVEGYFQAMNILCATGLAIASGSPSEIVFEHLKDLRPITGRLEFCGKNNNNAKIYVDYAHTPDALTAALFSLRELTEREIILVFGCGGNRDSIKRAIMGEIAENFSDKVIITDDNPRDENPKKIREAILKNCPSAIEISDRQEAISKAISMGEKGDSIIIAGKGHEKIQIIGNNEIPFSDQETVRNIIGN
ncbi:MAG: UDP-N-acetylmuramoyl-L-alanyl-D-glutamate--2,6-diaminopimelate ligase [Pseudomonadota bacterium]|nr:UDP-N-acetylmuramoyl-L-alanyl-D-glutamate--2,6-diaminopimelate ligase [Pseudomonadota bacterium]